MSTIQMNTFMCRALKLFLLLPLVILLAVCGVENTGEKPPSASESNTLTPGESEAGWELLFDGKSLQTWRGIGLETVPEGHWTIEDGAIKKIPSGEVPLQDDGQPLQGGDLMTADTFEDFELSLEWKISPGGNSGIKYNVSEEMSMSYPPKQAALGFEYQVLDNDLHLDGKIKSHRTAGLYDLIEPERAPLKPVGEYNTARILFQGSHGEHWLNGVKVLEYDLDTETFQELIANSKYRNIEDFARKRKGHIILQDHTDAVWFRNIKIRRIK
jgi:hypothetical protein